MRSFLAIVVHHDVELYHNELVTEFLNGDLDEDIYMEEPVGFKDPNRPSLSYRLLKALYGVKQVPRQW